MRKIMSDKKAQTWSTDLLLAAGLFLLTFVVFFYVIQSSLPGNRVADLKDESTIISLKVSDGSGQNSALIFIVNNKVDNNRLIIIANTDYEELKAKLGLSNDFCIYFEDENGNLINLSEVTGQSGVGIGSSRIKISGIPCGSI